MSNQVCLRTLSTVGDEVICHEDAHILHYEAGAAAALSGLQLRPLVGEYGVLSEKMVTDCIRAPGEHSPRTAVVEMEKPTTVRWHYLALRHMAAVAAAARSGSARPLDGLAYGTPRQPACRWPRTRRGRLGLGLFQGLGCSGRSALAARIRGGGPLYPKRFGGAMRQGGIVAAAACTPSTTSTACRRPPKATILARYLVDIGVELIHPVRNILIADVGSLDLTAAGGGGPG
jgi:threonine aldolase